MGRLPTEDVTDGKIVTLRTIVITEPHPNLWGGGPFIESSRYFMVPGAYEYWVNNVEQKWVPDDNVLHENFGPLVAEQLTICGGYLRGRNAVTGTQASGNSTIYEIDFERSGRTEFRHLDPSYITRDVYDRAKLGSLALQGYTALHSLVQPGCVYFTGIKEDERDLDSIGNLHDMVFKRGADSQPVLSELSCLSLPEADPEPRKIIFSDDKSRRVQAAIAVFNTTIHELAGDSAIQDRFIEALGMTLEHVALIRDHVHESLVLGNEKFNHPHAA